MPLAQRRIEPAGTAVGQRLLIAPGIAGTVLALLSVLSILAGCARLSQPGSLPSAEQQCANVGGMWSNTGGLCRYPGQ